MGAKPPDDMAQAGQDGVVDVHIDMNGGQRRRQRRSFSSEVITGLELRAMTADAAADEAGADRLGF